MNSEHSREDIKRFISSVRQLETKSEKMYADSVLSAVTRANDDVIERLKREDSFMCKELMEIMRPEIDAEISAEINANSREIAMRLIKLRNNSDEDIANCTGLSLEDIREIKKVLNES